LIAPSRSYASLRNIHRSRSSLIRKPKMRCGQALILRPEVET
jgi:hypothetical protein